MTAAAAVCSKYTKCRICVSGIYMHTAHCTLCVFEFSNIIICRRARPSHFI